MIYLKTLSIVMENNEQTQTKICDNCLKSFPSEKIDLHEAYCRRNIKKCILCFQMYDINDQEAHQRQFHSKKECRYCSISFSENQWQLHQPDCKRRPIKCKYCENQIAFQEVLKHEDSCGSRTTKCQTCHKYIPLRQIDPHKITCGQNNCPIRTQQSALSRDDLRQNLRQNSRDYPSNLERIQDRRIESHRMVEDFRNHIPVHYRDPNSRNQRGDRIPHQRMNAISSEKNKNSANKKPTIKFEMNIKPSHIIQPERIRQMIDPVPISIRLAMGRLSSKTPLQNRN